MGPTDGVIAPMLHAQSQSVSAAALSRMGFALAKDPTTSSSLGT